MGSTTSLDPGTRDYMNEIMACVESNIPNWSVRHLSLWSELISSELRDSSGRQATEVDLVEVEEATTVALFNELKTKLSTLATRVMLVNIYYC